MNDVYGEFVVFADESGDHSLVAVDPEYPVFVLTLVVFKLDQYLDDFLPRFHRLKFETFGHDGVVLHEREMRRREGAFRLLHDERKRESFFSALNALISTTPFEVIYWVFDKRSIALASARTESIYRNAIRATLPQLLRFLESEQSHFGKISVIFESRGRSEDAELNADFRAFQLEYSHPNASQLDLHFVAKTANTAGIQLADLTARPIGLSVLHPDQRNRALDIVISKIVASESR